MADHVEGKSIEQERTESKRERTVRIIENRMSKILNQIRTLGNCASSNYEYTKDDVDKIFSVLADAINGTEKLFIARFSKTESKKGFKL